MEIHHLHYVVKLAKCLHFSKAATELSITQPSLSQRVLQIEQELGVKLFERKTRSVALTGAGEEFVLYAEKTLAAWEQLQEAMRQQSSTKKGTLRIGTLLNMARLDLSKQVIAFKNEHPHIQVTIDEIVGSLELIRQLEAEAYDVVFFTPSPEMKLAKRIETWPVIAGRVIAALPMDHPLAGNNSVAISELADEKLLFPARAHSLYGMLLTACRHHGFEPKIIAQFSQVDTAMEMAAKGMGIALLSSQFANASPHHNAVVLPLEPLIPRNITLAYSTQAANFSAIKVFRDFILQASGESAG